MSRFDIVSRRGKTIRSVETWGVEARPAKAEHWQDGRSAKELAKAWISGSGPAALAELFELNATTSHLRIDRAVAEAQTAFDRWPGGRRNHDLLVTGETISGKITIGVEGKADETFGQTLQSYADGSQRLIDRGKPTNAHLRLDELTTALVGVTLSKSPELSSLRYQLFSAVAGTLAAAELGSVQAALVVHEFITERTNAKLHAANAAALSAFTERVFRCSPPVGESSWLLGPFNVAAERWERVPLWIGKIETET